MSGLTRRHWLSLALGVMGLVGGALVRRSNPWPRKLASVPGESVVRRLNALVNASGELCELGELQRPSFPSRLDTDRTLRELFPGRTWEQLQALEDHELEELLRRSTEADFASGRIVVVGGWFLAKTEASLCQLTLT